FFLYAASSFSSSTGPASTLSLHDALPILVVDSGKDGWETQPGFPDLAAEIQAAATTAGLRAAPAGLGFVQAFLSAEDAAQVRALDRKSTRLNSSHVSSSYAVFCLQKKNKL